MPTTLPVHVNRDGVRSVAPEVPEIEVDGPFDLQFENHGQPAHVHVYLDDALAAVSHLPESNWYVEGGETRTVTVDVESLDAVAGRLKIATGYGAQEAFVDVNVQEGSGGVQVDEELSKPRPEPEEPEPTSLAPYVLPVAFVLVGILVAAVVAVLVEGPMALAYGGIAIIASVAAAVYLVLGA